MTASHGDEDAREDCEEDGSDYLMQESLTYLTAELADSNWKARLVKCILPRVVSLTSLSSCSQRDSQLHNIQTALGFDPRRPVGGERRGRRGRKGMQSKKRLSGSGKNSTDSCLSCE